MDLIYAKNTDENIKQRLKLLQMHSNLTNKVAVVAAAVFSSSRYLCQRKTLQRNASIQRTLSKRVKVVVVHS